MGAVSFIFSSESLSQIRETWRSIIVFSQVLPHDELSLPRVLAAEQEVHSAVRRRPGRAEQDHDTLRDRGEDFSLCLSLYLVSVYHSISRLGSLFFHEPGLKRI